MKKEMNELFKKVVTGNVYDLDKANTFKQRLISAQITARDMPSIANAHIMREHYGDSMIYSMALYKLLRENGDVCYFSHTLQEDSSSYYSVCYYYNDTLVVADPASSIVNSRKNDYAISVEDFKEKNGSISIYDPYGFHGNLLFFSGFLYYPLTCL